VCGKAGTVLPRKLRGNWNDPREDHRGSLDVIKSSPCMMILKLTGGQTDYPCPESSGSLRDPCCMAHRTSRCWPQTSPRSVRRRHIPRILNAATIGLQRTQSPVIIPVLIGLQRINIDRSPPVFPMAKRVEVELRSKRIRNPKHNILIGSSRSGLPCGVMIIAPREASGF